MKSLLTILAIFALIPATASANHADGGTLQKDVAVEVNGLVCDFCARALEKVFGKRDEVHGIHVDLSAGEVAIDLNDNQNMSDEEITALITDAGYNVVKINRPEIVSE